MSNSSVLPDPDTREVPLETERQKLQRLVKDNGNFHFQFGQRGLPESPLIELSLSKLLTEHFEQLDRIEAMLLDRQRIRKE